MLDWKRLSQPWKKHSAKKKHDQVVGLSRNNRGLAVCLAQRDSAQDKWHIEHSDYLHDTDSQSQLAYLKSWVKKHKLEGCTCHYTLGQDDYELLLLEAPPVNDAELLDATIWRVNKLIQTPLSNTVIDVMRLPSDAYRNRKDMLYAVAATESIVKEYLNFVNSSKLVCQVIDIPQMAHRNLVGYHKGESSNSIGFLKLEGSQAEILVILNGAMYFSRKIEMTDDPAQLNENMACVEITSSHIKTLVQDLKRSLDYYETQLGVGAVHELQVLPIRKSKIDIAQELSKDLSISVDTFWDTKKSDFGFHKTPPEELMPLCMNAVGVALRHVQTKQNLNLYSDALKEERQPYSARLAVLAMIISFAIGVVTSVSLNTVKMVYENHEISVKNSLKDIENRLYEAKQNHPSVAINQALLEKIQAAKDHSKQNALLLHHEKYIERIITPVSFSNMLLGIEKSKLPNLTLTEVVVTNKGHDIRLVGKASKPHIITQYIALLGQQGSFDDMKLKVMDIKRTRSDLNFVLVARKLEQGVNGNLSSSDSEYIQSAKIQ